MTSFGLAIVVVAIQVTLFALFALVAIACIGRRSPRTAAALAATALVAGVLLSVVSHVPTPQWWTWEPPIEPVAQATATSNVPAEPVSQAADRGWRISLSQFSNVLKPVDAQSPETRPQWNAWEIIAVLFLVGVGIEAVWLAAGLVGVRVIRRRSSPVTDRCILAEVDELRMALGITQSVVVRQSNTVGTTATVGWWKPMVLLAADWQSWTFDERQAVLAHELAHVQRRDYLTVVVATMCRAVHFYHPLVRALASRLRLHQELAADALAASITSGRTGYLRALARLALRNDAAISAGFAQAFLSDRTSLIRRIGMLRVMDDRRPLGRRATWVLVASLGFAAFIVSAVRGPAQSPAQAQPAVAELSPWELSCVPASSNFLQAIRPAAIVSRPEMKAVAERLNVALAKAIRDGGFLPELVVKCEEIEQIVIAGEGRKMSSPPGVAFKPDQPQHAMLLSTVLVRMNHDFDWPAVIRKNAAVFKAEVKEEPPGLFLVSTSDYSLYFKVVDKRTICLLEGTGEPKNRSIEEVLARMKPAADPTAAWGPTWSRMSGAAACIAYDNRSGFWTTSLNGNDALAGFLNPLGRPKHVIAGLDLADTIGLQLHSTSADEKIAELSRVQIEGIIAMALGGILQVPVETDTGKLAIRIAGELLENRSIQRNGTTVSAEFRSPTKLAELFKFIDLPGELNEYGKEPRTK